MLEIIKAGWLTTIQDLGRANFANIGVSSSGAIDKFSLSLANILLNNPINTATLEIVISPFVAVFKIDTYIAITGSNCDVYIDTEAVALGWRIAVKAGQQLTIGPNKNSGFCCYLAVAGGFICQPVLGSASTDIKCGFGGLGRKIIEQDLIAINNSQPLALQAIGIRLPEFDGIINILRASEYDEFSLQSQQLLCETKWLVTTNSNRMGIRLHGQSLTRVVEQDLLSHGVFCGVIQVPANGQPIILSAEAQSTGGYPKIAVIALADLWKLGYLAINKSIKFRLISIEKARKDYQKQGSYLTTIKRNLLLQERMLNVQN